MTGTCDIKNDDHQGLHATGKTGTDEQGDYEIWACQCGARTVTMPV